MTPRLIKIIVLFAAIGSIVFTSTPAIAAPNNTPSVPQGLSQIGEVQTFNSDTIKFDANLKAYTINPYAIFEFIEPDNLKTFSFAIRADFIHENTTKDEAVPGDGDSTKLNNFRRSSIGGGPISSRFPRPERQGQHVGVAPDRNRDRAGLRRSDARKDEAQKREHEDDMRDAHGNPAPRCKPG